jgi:hypothetical protein
LHPPLPPTATARCRRAATPQASPSKARKVLLYSCFGRKNEKKKKEQENKKVSSFYFENLITIKALFHISVNEFLKLLMPAPIQSVML